MSEIETGQVTRSAAEVYEEFFLPALFQEWTSPVANAARIVPNHRVLDVACGTGVLARAVSDRVGAGGSVVGLDLNEGMVSVAGATHRSLNGGRGEPSRFLGQPPASTPWSVSLA